MSLIKGFQVHPCFILVPISLSLFCLRALVPSLFFICDLGPFLSCLGSLGTSSFVFYPSVHPCLSRSLRPSWHLVLCLGHISILILYGGPKPIYNPINVKKKKICQINKAKTSWGWILGLLFFLETWYFCLIGVT